MGAGVIPGCRGHTRVQGSYQGAGVIPGCRGQTLHADLGSGVELHRHTHTHTHIPHATSRLRPRVLSTTGDV